MFAVNVGQIAVNIGQFTVNVGQFIVDVGRERRCAPLLPLPTPTSLATLHIALPFP